MFERGVVMSYVTIHRRRHTFGPCVAAAIRQQRPQPKDKVRLDEVSIKMGGRTCYLWLAVDVDIAGRRATTAQFSSCVSRSGETCQVSLPDGRVPAATARACWRPLGPLVTR
jgi:hypothetical protein